MPVTHTDWIEADRRIYRTKQRTSDGGLIGIKDALDAGVTGIITEVSPATEEQIFYMLCFCLAVPQSKAIKVEEAIEELRSLDYYNRPVALTQIREVLRSRARFHNRKATYLTLAAEIFRGGFWEQLQQRYKLFIKLESDGARFSFLRTSRSWLAKIFKGMGLKEASHFLRNIGMRGLAILDVHVIRGLQKRGLVSADIQLDKATYHSIEDTILKYAAEVGIDLDELDLLLWSQRTGFVFK